ncbi:MAG: phage tail protein [Kofleriaceae bacterium]
MASQRKDPLPVFCFKVELALSSGAVADAFFKSVSGLRSETEVVPVREGGANDTTFQLVGATKWSNIVLKQGFTGSSAMLQWRQDWITGAARNRVPTGKIIQLNTALDPVATWTFFRGWPVKWELSELDASKSELAMETLEIAHEGIKFG